MVVSVPFLTRPVALPVLATLAVKGGRSKPDLARNLVAGTTVFLVYVSRSTALGGAGDVRPVGGQA